MLDNVFIVKPVDEKPIFRLFAEIHVFHLPV
jgi:hypothetical protein